MSESCCNGRTKDNFFHRFTNISSWMETEIKKILESKKFTVIFMEVNAQLMILNLNTKMKTKQFSL